jgi:hypothetical protein
MNKRKSTKPFYAVITVVSILAIGLAAFAYSGYSPKILIEGDYIEAVQPAQEQLGSVTGPDFYGPYFGINEVKRYSDSMQPIVSTTTPCAFKSPSATSTLTFASAMYEYATGTLMKVRFYRSANPFASTTALSSLTTWDSVGGTLIASTTDDSVDTVFPPDQYLVFWMQGHAFNNAVATAPVGKCQAEFISFK